MRSAVHNFGQASLRTAFIILQAAALVICTAVWLPAVHAQSLSHGEIADLVFPAGTDWQNVPVVKWDHKPNGLIVVSGNISSQEMATIKTSLDALKTKADIADIAIVTAPIVSSDLLKRTDAANFTIVFGPQAIQDSLAGLRPLLSSAVPDDVTAEAAAGEAIQGRKPAFSKFRFDPATGLLKKSVTFADTNGNAVRVQGILTLALLYSLSPSVLESQAGQLLLFKDPGGLLIGDQGYKYLKLLYSPTVPVGTRAGDLLNLHLD
jgi:hypothetical protein